MPPETAPIPLPKGRGRDVIDWLAAHGYTHRIPLIRSGSFESVSRCPFLYYLTDRLSLTPALDLSESLEHGTWFHKRLELFDKPPEDRSRLFSHAVQARISEIDEYCKAFGIAGEGRTKLLSSEEDMAKHAWVWYEAAADVRVLSPGQPDGGPLSQGFEAWLTRPQHKILARELFAVYRHPRYEKTALAARFDMLVLHVPQNTLWIVDAKTTKKSTVARAQTCPFEMQTHHYLYILKSLLETGVLAEHFPEINAETRVGGMRHLIVKKPGIRLSGQDRPFTLDETPLKSGPRKGQPRNEKVYHGEPQFPLYAQRVRDWYLAQGDYLHEAAERQSDPVVNLSTTSAAILDDWLLDEYHEKLDYVYRYATRDPIPSNFPRDASGMMDPFSGEPTVYARFFAAHPANWPSLIRESHLVQSPRDPAYGPDSLTGIYL